jgi:adenylate cyclase class 2
VDGTTNYEMTIKRLINLTGDVKTFDEKTVLIDSEKSGIEFLKSLGLVQTTYVYKTRKSYNYKNCLFEFDVLIENGKTRNYLEIESADESNLRTVLKEIKNLK